MNGARALLATSSLTADTQRTSKGEREKEVWTEALLRHLGVKMEHAETG